MTESEGIDPTSFEDLIEQAEEHPTSGWDFSWLEGRMRTTPLPWDFAQIVVDRARLFSDMLDMGTGGGEWLASLPYRPPRTVATESWAPNVPVATDRLGRLGIRVVEVDSAPDNVLQAQHEDHCRLPFKDESFHLVINRHESFVPDEVARILAPGGSFVTEQLGDGIFADFCEALDVPPPAQQPWSLSTASSQIERSGLSIIRSSEAEERVTFADVGALAWYLKMIPWMVPGFSIATHREHLAKVHHRIQEEGSLTLPLLGFYLEAVKPRPEGQ